MIRDTLDIQGYLTVQLFDRAGQLVHTQKQRNAIVYSGRELVARLFVNEKVEPIKYFAVGTSNSYGTLVEHAQLTAEVFRGPLGAFNPTQHLQEVTQDLEQKLVKRCLIKLQAEMDFNQPSFDVAMQEVGLFNSPEQGKGMMYNRVVFASPIYKTQEFRLSLNWDIMF